MQGRPLCASENTKGDGVLFPRGGKGTGSDRVLFHCRGTLFACSSSVDTGDSPHKFKIILSFIHEQHTHLYSVKGILAVMEQHSVVQVLLV